MVPVDGYGTKFDRLWVVHETPFKGYKDNFEIDEEGLRQYFRYILQSKFVNGGGGLMLAPEAGDLWYMNRKENKRVLEIAVEECGGKIPIFTGLVGFSNRELIERAIEAKDLGIDGIFPFPPRGLMDVSILLDAERHPEVWINQLKAIDGKVDMPIIPHPAMAIPKVPWSTGLPLKPTLQMIREIPNIVGWKMMFDDDYDGFSILGRVIRSSFPDRHIGILMAAPHHIHEALANDLFDGCVNMGFNYAMEPMVDHIEAWRRGDIAKAKDIWSKLVPLHHRLFFGDYQKEIERSFHIRTKIASWLRGVIPTPYSPPPVPKPEKSEILGAKNALVAAGLSVIEDREINKVLDNIS